MSTQRHEWTLEIVPAHADRVDLFRGLVKEIFVTMIPGTPAEASLEALPRMIAAGFAPVPHIAARNFNKEEELDAFFSRLRHLNVRKALLLAGGHGQVAGPFRHTLDMLSTDSFARAGLKCVAVAGHPEGNPEDPQSWQSLEAKWEFLQNAGIGMEIVTQWSFSPEAVNSYLDRLRERGITAPVRVGIAGPASLKTLLKYAKICGVSASAVVIKKQGFNMGRLLLSNDPAKFVSKVKDHTFFHLYPFGGLEKCSHWLAGRVEAELPGASR